MTLSLKSLICSVLLTTVAFAALSAPDTDNKTRQNPQLEAGNNNSATGSKSYIDYAANNIIMNGRNWSALARTLQQSVDQQKPVSIVHIGDSHIQAEGATSRIRATLQNRFGNGGRGLMIPFKIAGTNQPLDYRISLDAPATTATMMRMPWPTTMGFTGVSVSPKATHSVFTVKPETDFTSLTVYGTGDFTIENVTAAGIDVEHKITEQAPGIFLITFARPIRDARVSIDGDSYNIFGFEARGVEKGGLIYSAIGNNGATYQTYLKVGNVGKSLVNMHPSLVIISLGANEAFGNITNDAFYANIDKLVTEIKRENPGVEILLTTPSECQRSSYVTSTTKRKGKRKRSSTQRIRTYQVNTNVERLRQVILRYGREKGVPVYDFYAVAGGEGSSAKWLADGLLSSDRIHRTWAGYRTEGDLMADALNRALVSEPEKKTTKSGIKTQTPGADHKNRNRKYSTKAKNSHNK